MYNDLLHKEVVKKIEKYRNDLSYVTLGTETLLLALLDIEDSLTCLILNELGVYKNDILDIINNSIYIRDGSLYTHALKNIFKRAEELANEKDFVYDEAYLYSLLENENTVAMDILNHFHIEGKNIIEELEHALKVLEEDNAILINLTKKAKNKELNKFIGRTNYIDSVDTVLNKKQKNNCMLIGPAGVGKSGIVEGLAEYYWHEHPYLTIYQLDIGSLIAGTRYRGDLEEKLMDVLESIKGKDNILFIDEIHNILNNSNNENSIDIGNLLKPYLARSLIKCIGATTVDEYHKTIAKDKALARRFKNIYVFEPNYLETKEILMGIKKDFEDFYQVRYSKDIIDKIIQASSYLTSLNNPDKAIDVMDECGIYAKKNGYTIISFGIVKEVIFNSLGLNIKKCLEKVKKTSSDIKQSLHEYFNFCSSKYIMFKKTFDTDYYINQFQEILNIDDSSVLVIDANDYNSEHLISTLLGASPGYVGYEDGGILSKQILEHNINIIVFKNYSKGDFLDKKIISKLFSFGLIKDYRGRSLNFKNSIILLEPIKMNKIGF